MATRALISHVHAPHNNDMFFKGRGLRLPDHARPGAKCPAYALWFFFHPWFRGICSSVSCFGV